MKRKVVIALLVGCVAFSFIGCSETESTNADTETESVDEDEPSESESEVDEEEEGDYSTSTSIDDEPEDTDPSAGLSFEAQNAYNSAMSYLNMSGFSKAKLYEQLTSEYGEGYTKDAAAEAIVAIENAGLVDWNEEAVESAQSYLNMSGFSAQQLYEQLTSSYGEGYTAEQAKYALSQVGY